VQDPKIVPKLKIGILKESSFLPCSDSVKRAMKIAEKAARDLGYDVVEFSYSQDVWRWSMDYQVGLLSNGDVPMMIDEVNGAGESWLPAMKKNADLLKMGSLMRWFVDNIILPIKRENRLGRILKFARVLGRR
jgi:hypothetical protein